ncbi:sensor histidine kinase-like protein/response regulator Fos-1 [Lindgomyces ingoldianus]|uniref:Sensor histidine kinase-like protein/response regulator Fos-1 n=1 Tax=Lindgomyces ingoldianus TaxID=673940 RepID=A0ACB6R4C0_9PLEO|nr:sensor histidine kinase-like protein/response regulator Fos-1 [Lindgomyces ingoldianus]KAF2474118.1 sensor histidine kinase-like protein/response regulator Fos-1 [Lindgomyces ingoldianus]
MASLGRTQPPQQAHTPTCPSPLLSLNTTPSDGQPSSSQLSQLLQPLHSLQSAKYGVKLEDSFAHDIFCRTLVPSLWLDSSLVVCQVSDSFLEVSGGCRREQVVGLHTDDLFGQRVIIPSLGSAREAIRSAQELKKPYEVEDVQPDGKTIWTIRAVPIYRHDQLRYVQMELKDTTAEHQRYLDLEERVSINETFRILVETVKDYAIFMLDPHGNVATWNQGAQTFKGYAKEEIVGKHFSSFYSQEDCDNGKPAMELETALRDGRVEDEGWRYRKDGTRFWANVVITPVYREGTLIGFGKVTRDLTERRAAEARLITAYEEASKLKSEFLANMSHEIRTPMHGMLSALTLLLDTSLDPNQLDLARIIEESGSVLLQVINDILDYSKLASGCFSISSDIISVSDIIQSVFRSYQKSEPPTIRLEIKLDPKLPKAAEGDSLRYRQIVQNLMSNATKFTDEGYVRVNANLQEENEDSYLILTEVIDTGIGVLDGSLGSLFIPFTQFDNSATKRYKGTGLGLSICKGFAELMGGNIGFRPNADHRGSIFWFTARLKKVKLKHISVSQGNYEVTAINSSNSPLEDMKLAAVKRRVLLAEDNQINQKVMLKMLAGLGFDNIDLAADGREAVNMAAKLPPPYDVILMDINMPILDGVGATREIRNAGVWTPIVAMTANALKGQAELYIAKGMNDYISKPVDRNLLVKALLNCLKHHGPDQWPAPLALSLSGIDLTEPSTALNPTE